MAESRFSLLLVLAVFITACTATQTPTPTSILPTDTPISTATMVPSLTPTSSSSPTLETTLTPTPTNTPVSTATPTPPEISGVVENFCQNYGCQAQWDGENWQLITEYGGENSPAQAVVLGEYVNRNGQDLLKVKVSQNGERSEFEVPLEEINISRDNSRWSARLAPPTEWGKNLVFSEGKWETVDIGPIEVVSEAGVRYKIDKSPENVDVYINDTGALDFAWYYIITLADIEKVPPKNVTPELLKEFIQQNPTLDEFTAIIHAPGSEYIGNYTAAIAPFVEGKVRTDEVIIKTRDIGDIGQNRKMVGICTHQRECGGYFFDFSENEDGTLTTEINLIAANRVLSGEFIKTTGVQQTDVAMAPDESDEYFNIRLEEQLFMLSMAQISVGKTRNNKDYIWGWAMYVSGIYKDIFNHVIQNYERSFGQ